MKKMEYEYNIMQMFSALPEETREQFFDALQARTHNPVQLYGWNVWIGYLGIDRFIVGDVLAGILKLFTLGGLGFWVLVDCFLIGNRARDRNMEIAEDLFQRFSRQI